VLKLGNYLLGVRSLKR